MKSLTENVLFLAADPGPVSGAVVVIDVEGNIFDWTLMPNIELTVMKTRDRKQPDGTKKKTTKPGKQTDTNISALRSWFELACAGKVVYGGVEDVKTLAIGSKVTNGLLQRNKAALECFCYVYCKKLFMLTVGQWHKEFYQGNSDKGKAIKIAQEICPEIARIIQKAKTDEQKGGIAESFLMAEGIRRRFVQVKYLKEKKNA